MFKVNTKDLKRLEKDLKTFASKALPFATRSTINNAAFTARKLAQTNIREGMVNRNKFTANSIRVGQSRTLKISKQSSTVGSIADYMEDQEFGGLKTSKGKEGTPIATSYSAGQGLNAQPRTRLSRRPNTLRAIKLSKRRKGPGVRKQQNIIAIKQAAKTGRRFVFLDLSRRKGIFKVVGGVRRTKIKMVHDLTSKTVRIPRNPWLAPAVVDTKRQIPGIYFKALEFQARRRGLFR